MSETSDMSPCIYLSRVMHKRLAPVSHRFVYRVFSFYLDLDRIDDLDRRLRLFSRNRWNLFSFWDRDHGPRDGSPLRPWIDNLLSRAGIKPDSLKVSLLCFPRLLGYAFNPLSIWFCRSAPGELRAVIYEVRNTFGEHHHYVFRVQSANSDEPLEHSCAKQMYVSPFIDEEATYHFRLHPPGEKLVIQIREYEGTDEVLIATQIGERAPLSDGWLARLLIIHPFMTSKVIAGIHWQAFRLWRRGVEFHSHTPAEAASVSLPGKEIEQYEEASSA
tara:strand:- start:2951 stop:3772 length:822 start_codon:yes stop_codon:yes gene_type:complete